MTLMPLVDTIKSVKQCQADQAGEDMHHTPLLCWPVCRMRKRELYRMCGAQSVVCLYACIACIAKTVWSLVCPGRTGRGKDL